MEFHNAKLLPKGLHEIIAAFVPYGIYPRTKVIAYHHARLRPPKLQHRVLGYARYDRLTSCFQIGLYPSLCCSSGVRCHNYTGTMSFQYWMAMLSTALHEVGHLAMLHLCQNLPHDPEMRLDNHLYVEHLANRWMQSAMMRILRVNQRLGQPVHALTGYPGILSYKLRNNWGQPSSDINPDRIIEWRALKCGGQITQYDIITKLYEVHGASFQAVDELDTNTTIKKQSQVISRMRRAIHIAARQLGISRYYISKNGRRYLMFNAGEAEAVFRHLVSSPWLYMPKVKEVTEFQKLKDSFGELYEVEKCR
ncbi:hypothetical protein ACFLXA_01690 [Chloroflexota bacterium]